MTNDSDGACPKITDFGLAALIGPGQKIKEACGTIVSLINKPFFQTYVAPEVLMQKAFGKSADVWSYGILVHALLLGTLPFDGDDTTKIARRIVNDEPDYNWSGFRKLSTSAQDIVKGNKSS
jgi:serine/threonine protein kinase